MTRVSADTLGIPDTGFPVLRDLVHERTGLFFDDARTDVLAERMAGLVLQRGFRSFLDLYYQLKYDDAAQPAWRDVFDALAVPETYFWREIDQIRAVACRVVPELAKRGSGPIRIWSVPCASGEEPLTIAMALNEAGWFDRADIQIHASDASPAAIARAREGQYRARSLRALPQALVEKYFVEDRASFAPVPELTDRIASWTVVNLMEPAETALLAHCPIIFCRNAFIYFSQAAVRRVVGHFASLMPVPGFLCVGASESLLNVTTDYALEEIDGAFVYVKRSRIDD